VPPIGVDLEAGEGGTNRLRTEPSQSGNLGESQENDPESIGTGTPEQSSSTPPNTLAPSKSMAIEDEHKNNDEHKDNAERKDNSEPEDKVERSEHVEEEEKYASEEKPIESTIRKTTLSDEELIEDAINKALIDNTPRKETISEEELIEKLKLKMKKSQMDRMGEIAEKLNVLILLTQTKTEQPSDDTAEDEKEDEEQQDEDIAHDIDVVDGSACTNGNEQNEVSEQARDEAEQPSGDTAEHEEQGNEEDE